MRDTEKRVSFTRGVTASPKRAVIDIGERASGARDGKMRKRERGREKETERDGDTSSRNVTNMVSQCLYTPPRRAVFSDFFAVAKVYGPAPSSLKTTTNGTRGTREN